MSIVFLLRSRLSECVVRNTHYLSEVNPVRQPKDLVTCVLNNVVFHDSEMLICNKPPGLMVLGKGMLVPMLFNTDPFQMKLGTER
jgi:23S rRNA-/tRNA-specific pseudouridylate synthase